MVIGSWRARAVVGALWLVFAAGNVILMFLLPGEETIPYHLVWVSFSLLYGLAAWSRGTTAAAFGLITIATGVPLITHARNGVIGWEECLEIVLMAIVAALLVWHVRRSQRVTARLETVRAAEAVRARNRELTSRFGSHELRTRLTITRSLIELVRSQATSVQVHEDTGLAINELDKALATATNLLALVRVDDPDDVVVMDFAVLVADLRRRWEINVDRQWHFASDAMIIRAEAERLEAAVDCLIENAVKFTGDFDEITVIARRHHDAAVLVVEDTGCGIPAEDLERVAALFETSRSAGARAGSGLGLGIVRAVADSHGGTMSISSVLGRGTRVELRLPLNRPRSAEAAVAPLPMPAGYEREHRGGPAPVPPYPAGVSRETR